MDEANNFIDVYRQEADELLTEIEETVLEIEENPEEREAVNRLFRAVHTIKGSGAMFGFEKIVNFTHGLETVLDRVRDGILPITKDLIDLILKSRDHIKTILDSTGGNDCIDQEYEDELVFELNSHLSIADANAVEKEESYKVPNLQKEEDIPELTYRIRFNPHKNIFLTGMDPALLLDELKEFGDYEITPRMKNIPDIEKLNPEECYIYWDIVITTRKSLDEIKDVFIFVIDDCDLVIDVIDEENGFDDDSTKKLGEILIERQEISCEEINTALVEQKRLGELLVESNRIDNETIESALAEQKQLKKIKEKRHHDKGAASSLRVASEKLDTLVDLVGELVTVQARLSQFSANEDHAGLLSIAEEVERLTTELRDNTMSIRMMPIGTTFSKFRRLVRDLSSDLGKQVEMITEGAETELDKTVIDKLDDPLIHLIRNSIDHGIESPEVRKEAGKPEQGTIRLSAAHKGAYVVITIEDDGAGLNVDAIKNKAIAKNIISKDALLPDKEIFELIFAPGFSTADNITNVSGRGVGMDVVKKTIESLRGSIEIDSVGGKGSTITLKLPLTLAIINGLLVTIGGVYYVLPLASVEECVELSHKTSQPERSNILNVRGEIVPYVRLRDHFEIKDERPRLEHIVIADVREKRIGFVVDNVIGGHQTVIKSLGPAFKHMKDISGATILGDGTVALILDVNSLI